MKKFFIYLACGVVLTVLFLVFATQLMETLYYEREFSNEMYNQNLYFVVALVDVLVAWGLAAIYYYAINSVSFSRWYHWLLVVGVACALVMVINFAYPRSVFSAEGLDFSSQLFGFNIANLAIEVALMIVASFAMRWWSSNCRHTPIPE